MNSRWKLLMRDHLAARHVAQLGPVLEEDRRRELGQERLGQVELDVEPLQPREHLDLHLREDLPAGGVLGVRQRRVREELARPDLLRAEPRQLLPGHARRQSRGRPDGERLAARHLRPGIEPRREVVARLEQLPLGGHHLRLLRDVGLHDLLGGLHRPLRVEGVAREVEAEALPLVGLRLRRGGGGRVLSGILLVVRRLPLLRPGDRDRLRRLSLLHRVGGNRGPAGAVPCPLPVPIQIPIKTPGTRSKATSKGRLRMR